MLFVNNNLNKFPITTNYIFTYLMENYTFYLFIFFFLFFFLILDYNYDINQISIETLFV